MKIALQFITAVLLFSTTVFAQTNWNAIESNINNKKNLTTLYENIENLQQEALQRKEYFTVARCYNYLIRIKDLKTEDTLFFKNASCLDSLIEAAETSPALLSAVYVLKAKRIVEFSYRFFYQGNKNLFTESKKVKYSEMSKQALDSTIDKCFAKAIDLSKQLTNAKAEETIWLATDPFVFLYKPNYTDIIYAEKINVFDFLKMSFKQNFYNEVIKLNPDDFLISLDSIKGVDKSFQSVMKMFREWANENKNNKDKYYFIETLARKYFHKNINETEKIEKSYEEYLESQVNSKYTAVRANCVYQLCIYWNRLGLKYNQSDNSYYYGSTEEGKYKPEYRDYFKMALKLYEQNENMLDSFSFIKNILLTMKDKINEPKLNIKTERNVFANKAVKIDVTSKNVQTIYFKTIRIPASGLNGSNRISNRDFLKNTAKGFFSKIDLPLTNDYQTHKVKVTLEGVPIGHYAILYSNAKIVPDSNSIVDYITITVTNLAVINNDNRVFVLDRTTGFPTPNTTIQTIRRAKNYLPEIFGIPTKTNKEGWLTVSEDDADDIRVVNGEDTLIESFSVASYNLPREIFDKEKDETLVDYYLDKLKFQMFTDRAIYRPGQTVHYKGIFFVNDPYTGKMIVLNKKNVNLSWFQKHFNEEVKEILKNKIDIFIQNPFGVDIDTLHVLPNDFGSFSGSYKLSKDAALGKWEFDGDGIDMINDNSANFKVEEYMRPQYELTLEKPTNFLQLGDSFIVRAKVKSFAGASLKNVSLNYNVVVSGSFPYYDSVLNKFADRYESIKLNDSDVVTNNEGFFDIKINAKHLENYNFKKEEIWNLYYKVEVEATDQSGETHEESIKIALSNRPIQILYNISNILERKNLLPIYVTTKNAFAGDLQKMVKINIYKTAYAPLKNNNNDSQYDFIIENATWKYVGDKLDENEPILPDEKIFTSILTTKTDDKFIFPTELLNAGNYKIEIICEENGMVLGSTKKSFQVFDKDNNAWADTMQSFHFMQQNAGESGQKIKWVSGNRYDEIFSIYHVQYFTAQKKKIKMQYLYNIKKEEKGINELEYTIPKNALDEILLSHIYIKNNVIITEEKTIYVTKPTSAEPEIIIDQYRKKLMPGAKEKFVVSIKTKYENVLAELMTTMYDASLDKLEKHEWKIPNERVNFKIQSSWTKSLNGNEQAVLFNEGSFSYSSRKSRNQPLYWLNPMDYAYSELQKPKSTSSYDEDGNLISGSYLQGRAAGLTVMSTPGLESVVVTSGYGAKKSMASTSSIIIRGSSSITGANVAFVILDGVPYEGDLSKINPNLITDAIVFKGADGVALYGSRAENGVLILSTKGPVVLPKPEEAPIVIRKNFSETAFFYPNIYADADGFYNIEFTMPESVTEWKWKLLAHTKKAQFISAERNIVTQLPMMVQPNMPRFLYQGDKIVLQTRVTNLDSLDLNGKMKCIIEDAVTGENITATLVNKNEVAFSVSQKSNSNSAFEIAIPENLLHPLKIKITARAGDFSDGEEHIIPVLSKKILVTQNVPYTISNAKDTSITTPAMPADATPYGIGMYIAPKAQAAILNALPYLAFYQFNCAEQTFNKILAHSIANKILQTDTVAQKTVAATKADKSNNKADILPDELSEETMPWLQLANAASINQKNLVKLFDSTNGNTQIEKYINDLKDLQNADGGITWFKGGKSSKYVSTYILIGFSKLKKGNFISNLNPTVKNTIDKMIPTLVSFCDATLMDTINYWGNDLQYISARSLFKKEYPFSANQINRIEYVLKKYWTSVDKISLNEQANLIMTTMLYANKEESLYKDAAAQLESIRQLAINDNVNGIRWKDIADTDDLNSNTEETITNLAMAFEQVGHLKETIDGIIKWLLNAKQNHYWSTTKATAEVVGLLYRNQSSVIETPATITSTINKKLTVTDNLLKGALFAFDAMEKFPQTISVQKDNDVKCNAGFNYYYFTATPPVNTNYNALKISKKLYVKNGADWDVINDNTILHIADKVKTIITIDAPKQLKFVFLDEKRAATLEPADASSGYEYSKGFNYYKSVRDIGYQFFAEQIPSGISTIEYETVVSKAGRFSNGPIALQCMYKPEVRAYSGSVVLEVK
jgi:alpha-2-macroglobulin